MAGPEREFLEIPALDLLQNNTLALGGVGPTLSEMVATSHMQLLKWKIINK